MREIAIFAAICLIALFCAVLSVFGLTVAASAVAVAVAVSVFAGVFGQAVNLLSVGLLAIWREILWFLELMGAPIFFGILLQKIAVAYFGYGAFGIAFLSGFGLFLFNAAVYIVIFWVTMRLVREVQIIAANA